MRKLTACLILIVLALSLGACARASNEAPSLTTGWYGWSGDAMHMTQSAQLDTMAHETRDFHLPLTGGGGSIFGFGGRNDSAPAPAAPPPPMAADNAVAPDPVDWEDMAESGERLVIQNANVELDTEYFGEVTEALRQLAPSVGGFIESDMLTTRGRARFTIVMRIPAASFETVLAQVESMAYVRLTNQWALDVTDQFYDMAGSYRIRRLEEERILALIEQADTVHELLALEQRLSNTRLNIEMYLSQLNHMAGQIAYSTITVTLVDVSEVPPDVLAPGLGARVGGAFGDSVSGTVSGVQNVIVFLAGAIVPLMLLGMIALVVFVVVRKARKRYETSA